MSTRRSVPAPVMPGGASVIDAIGEIAVPSVVKLLSKNEAERMTQEIKLTASGIRNNLFKLRNQIDVAKSSNVWRVMGFASWTAYLADTLGEEPMRVSREERLQLVEYLAGEGLSRPAIASVIGVNERTVQRDFRVIESEQGETPVSPSQEPEGSTASADMAEPPKPAPVTGLDGKSYQRPAQAPRRSSIVDDARNAGYTLRKAVERLDRIRNDDRFARNREEILASMQSHLDFARDVLNDFGVEGFLTGTEER